MIAWPAPIQGRLARAERLIAQAAGQGAQLAVLPELFNTGYEYSDQNYLRAETCDGPTVSWMRQAAAQFGVHLAGSLLLRDGADIYNVLLLAAPDGRLWRYNKSYPWYWERAYFRKGEGTTVADTALGKIGMLLCWDVAHPKLWQAYAGRVELMVVCSCPPAAHEMTLVLPDGERVGFGDLGPLARRIRDTAGGTFGPNLRRQARVLKTPVVNTTGTGAFSSVLPSPRLSLGSFALMAPRLWKYLPRADSMRVEANYFNETYIADASGRVLQKAPAGVEGFALDEVALPDAPPNPGRAQPGFGISIFAYLFDALANASLALQYNREVMRQSRQKQGL
jgi:predicted amidohydrolase